MPVLIFIVALLLQVPSYSGLALYYRPGLMERVSQNRGMPVVSCMVSSPYEKLGTWLEVKGPKGTKTCRVTDVSHPKDRARHIQRGLVVELDNRSARQVCGTYDNIPLNCKVRVTRIAK
jgi:hypothetical protein